jgi:ATP-binding cassette subfamily C protein CydD
VALQPVLFEGLLRLGPEWSRQRVSGELAGTLIEQIEILDGFFVRYVPSVIAALFLPLAFGVALLPVDWIVALILLVTAPLIPVFMALVGWGAEAASRRHQLALTRLSGFFADRLRGAFTLKLFGREQAEIQTVRAASDSLSKKTMAVLRIAFVSSAVLELFAALGVASVALYVGLTYLGYLNLRATALTLPLGLFCLLLTPEVYGPLRQFAANYHDRAAARAAVGHMATVFGALPAVEDLMNRPIGPTSTPPPMLTPSIQRTQSAASAPCIVRVQGLTVRAFGREAAVLKDVSFCLAAGDKVALMGPSGAGKTTLLETLMGLRAVSDGVVDINGCNVFSRQDAEWRKKTVLIGQRAFFLPASIADNLRLANARATDQALFQALKWSCAEGFVGALPLGLATRLGVNGYGLSGGQLHRLALARLFLTNPDLVLLDEPTAHLDATMRDRLMASILRFAQGRTLIVATHDSDVAARLDRVLSVRDHTVLA